MQEFCFRDKVLNRGYVGVLPHNDINCLPFEYFRCLFAECKIKTLGLILSDAKECLLSKQVIEEVDELIEETMSEIQPKPEIYKVFIDNTLSCRQQENLLKGVSLSVADILWLNYIAQEMGYLLDVYHEQKYPKNIMNKEMPLFICQKTNESFDVFGSTDMTDGEKRALLEQRKVVQARIYHKANYWHCFYFTFKGLAGQENGNMGAMPHWHYISDKNGLSLIELKERIKTCNMPRSKVHIMIKRAIKDN